MRVLTKNFKSNTITLKLSTNTTFTIKNIQFFQEKTHVKTQAKTHVKTHAKTQMDEVSISFNRNIKLKFHKLTEDQFSTLYF